MGKKLLVMGATGTYSFALATTLMGLKEHSPNLFDKIIVYHVSCSLADQATINQIISVEFIEYSYRIKAKSPKVQARLDLFSPLTFARYECFNYLNDYEQVMWLDCDMLVLGDISPMLNYRKTGIAFARGYHPRRPEFTVQNDFVKAVPGYNMKADYFVACPMLLSNNLPDYQQYTAWCYNKTAQLVEYLSFPDQGILNLMLQEFKLEVDIFDKSLWGTYIEEEDTTNTKLLHAFANYKFWTNYGSIKKYPLWADYYIKWLEIGGSGYDGYTLKIKNSQNVVEEVLMINLQQLHNNIDRLEKETSFKGMLKRLSAAIKG